MNSRQKLHGRKESESDRNTTAKQLSTFGADSS